MADERVVIAVKIVDPDTTSQEGGVDASGRLAVNTEMPDAAALTDNFANPTAPAVGSFNMVWDGATWDRMPGTAAAGVSVDTELPAAAALADATANPTAPAVGSFAHVWNGATWDRLPGAAATGALVNTELPAAAALADDTANPTVPGVGSFLMGFDSGNTNWNRVEVDDAGHLQVDVLTGGGADSPTGPTVDTASTTDTAAGAEADLDSAEITEAEKLWGADLSASVAYRAELKLVENTVESTISILFGRAGEPLQWRPPHRDFAEHAGASAGTDVFRASITNMDTSQAANLYATFYYST